MIILTPQRVSHWTKLLPCCTTLQFGVLPPEQARTACHPLSGCSWTGWGLHPLTLPSYWMHKSFLGRFRFYMYITAGEVSDTDAYHQQRTGGVMISTTRFGFLIGKKSRGLLHNLHRVAFLLASPATSTILVESSARQVLSVAAVFRFLQVTNVCL